MRLLERLTFGRAERRADGRTRGVSQLPTASFAAWWNSKDLERSMIASSRLRLPWIHNCRHFVRRCDELRAELKAKRDRVAGVTATQAHWSTKLDPFVTFATFPRQIPSKAPLLVATTIDVGALCAQVEALRPPLLVNVAKHVLPTPEEVRLALTRAIGGPTRAVDLVRDIPADRRALARPLSGPVLAGCLALRGFCFQNAFQMGTLYVNVVNDTVVPNKSKIEILPFEQAWLSAIKDYGHFAQVAETCWSVKAWPNHVFPEIAPFFPLLLETQKGGFELSDAGG